MTHCTRRTLCTVSFAAGLFIVGLQSADARPKYLTVFREYYPDRGETTTCAICHPKTKKTERSEYGTAVGEALGKKNVTDEDAIKKALKKAEGKLPKNEDNSFTVLRITTRDLGLQCNTGVAREPMSRTVQRIERQKFRF